MDSNTTTPEKQQIPWWKYQFANKRTPLITTFIFTYLFFLFGLPLATRDYLWTAYPVIAAILLIYCQNSIYPVFLIIFTCVYSMLIVLVADQWFFFVAIAIVFLLVHFIDTVSIHYIQKKLPKSLKISMAISSCILFVFLYSLDIYGSRALSKTINKVRQKNIPVHKHQLVSRYRDTLRAEQNGVPVLLAYTDILRSKIYNKIPDSYKSNIPWLGSAKEWKIGEVLPPAEVSKIKELLDFIKPELQAMERALKYPQLVFPLNFSTVKHLYAMELPHLSRFQSYSKILALQVYYYSQTQDMDKALRSLAGIFKICKVLESEPFIISQVVKTAIHNRGIHASQHFIHHNLSHIKNLHRVQELIAPFCNYHPFNMVTECVMSFDFVRVSEKVFAWDRRSYYSSDPWDSKPYNDPSWFHYISRGWIKLQTSWILQDALQVAHIAQESEARFAAQRKMPVRSNLASLYNYSAISWNKIFVRELERLTYARSLWIAISIEIHYLKTKERLTIKQIGLQNPQFVLDPFNGQILLYAKQNDKAYIIYSVGENNRNDNGQINIDFETHKRKDIGVQISG